MTQLLKRVVNGNFCRAFTNISVFPPQQELNLSLRFLTDHSTFRRCDGRDLSSCFESDSVPIDPALKTRIAGVPQLPLLMLVPGGAFLRQVIFGCSQRSGLQ